MEMYGSVNPLFHDSGADPVPWCEELDARDFSVDFFEGIERVNARDAVVTLEGADLNAAECENGVCIICLEPLQSSKTSCRLTCGCPLLYHEECLLDWMHAKNGNSCPQVSKSDPMHASTLLELNGYSMFRDKMSYAGVV